MVLEEDARILVDGAVYAIRLHLPTTPTLFEHAASSCGAACSGFDHPRFHYRESSFEKRQVRSENHDCYGHTGNDVLGRSLSRGAFIWGLAPGDEPRYD